VRIGHGFDAHCFAADCTLILGGVTIPHEQGLEAHSDGDVLIHALCDALLGAAALGDIGAHFPDSNESYAGIDSRILLRSVIDLLAESGWQVGNIDMTIIAQAPKLASFIPKMREILAQDMRTDISAVSVKATTTEKMGYVGRKEGIAAHAVALIVPASP
jgi:2-C-methyl-D-erythritol 2,4-cyclodiphosphate synthase